MDEIAPAPDDIPAPPGSLMPALKDMDVAAVQALLESGAANLDERDDKGRTPLMVAVDIGGMDTGALNKRAERIALMLIEAGSDIEARDAGGTTPLLHAAREDGRYRSPIVDTLLAKGADVDAQDDNGMTALMWSAENGNPPRIRQLVAAGAALDKQDKNGMTALMHAVHQDSGYDTSMQALVFAGAATDIRDAEGRDVYSIAAEKGGLDVLFKFEEDKVRLHEEQLAERRRVVTEQQRLLRSRARPLRPKF